MRRLYPCLLAATMIGSLFVACRRNDNTFIVSDTISSPYTHDVCGTRSFHYSYSGTSTSHGSYIFRHDTVAYITYINDTFIKFIGTTFRCDTASNDSIVFYKSDQKDESITRFDIIYNIGTRETTINKTNFIGTIDPVNTFLNYTYEKWVSY